MRPGSSGPGRTRVDLHRSTRTQTIIDSCASPSGNLISLCYSDFLTFEFWHWNCFMLFWFISKINFLYIKKTLQRNMNRKYSFFLESYTIALFLLLIQSCNCYLAWQIIVGRGKILRTTTLTPQKKEVCAQWNVPVKRFKICYTLCIRKPMYFFSFFISCNFIFLPYECPGLCRHEVKI